MPIFAYRCDSCGFEKDVLQKRSDPPLSTCPACDRETFTKRLTAPAFQLKGSGWHVTDFRDNGKSKPKQGESGESGEAASAAGSGSGDAAADAKTTPASGGESARPAESPASKPAAKPASTPAATGAGGGSSTQAG